MLGSRDSNNSKFPMKDKNNFRRGSFVTARTLQRMEDMDHRQILGGAGIQSHQFGDRLLISANEPFHSAAGLQTREFVVKEEKDDYLICYPYCPAWTGTNKTVTDTEIAVAKPYLLQKTAWNNKKVLGHPGFIYEYLEPTGTLEVVGYGKNLRKVKAESGSPTSLKEVQLTYPPYHTGQEQTPQDVLLCAVRPTGIELEEDPKHPIQWIDLNIANRQWIDAGTLFINRSGETVIAGGCMQVQDIEEVQGIPLIKIKKPDNNPKAGFIFNGPSEIADGKIGVADTNAPYWAVSDDTGLVNGSSVGPKSGEWKLFKDRSGFVVWGIRP